jgi:hypothetical protein
VSGVHVWFPVNHAVAYANTRAFHVTSSGNRFHGCYIDGGRAVLEGDALKRTVWSQGFECCQRGTPATGTPASGIVLLGNSVGPGLQLINNDFASGSIVHRSARWWHDDDDDFGGGGGGGGGRGTDLDTRAHVNVSSPGHHRLGPSAHDDCPSRHLNCSSDDRDCQGLSDAAAGAKSLAACAAACCADPACSVYQWCPAGGGCDGATGSAPQCWIGDVSGCGLGVRSGWRGMGSGQRPVPPPKVQGVRIAHNHMGSGAKASQATLSLTQSGATSWPFDFCGLLVFPLIQIVRVHLVAEKGFPTAVARPPSGCKVTVETDVPVTGTITVDVDSSAPSSEFA